MDFRVALIFLVLNIAPATCRSIMQNESLNKTIGFIQKSIRTALDKLDGDELLPNTACPSIDVTGGLLGPFLCYTVTMSTETPGVSDELLDITQSIENATNGTASHDGCDVPKFKGPMDKYKFVQCLLLLLDQRLRKV